MGSEIDLLAEYPKSRRDVDDRAQTTTEEDRFLARRFGREFFDGERRHGYGGFRYHPRFWQPVIPTLKKHFDLTPATSLLDVGCAKGFLLHDLEALIPGMTLRGVDVSKYAIENAIEDMRPRVQVADARALPFADRSFDVVISINTIHNLDRPECAEALQEIQRVSRGKAFVTVDAYRTSLDKTRMLAWNLTARTILHVDEWKAFFAKAGYTGDYFWFIP